MVTGSDHISRPAQWRRERAVEVGPEGKIVEVRYPGGLPLPQIWLVPGRHCRQHGTRICMRRLKKLCAGLFCTRLST